MFRYIYGCIPQDQLAAFYRDAQIALITPLRDGMNLVAKVGDINNKKKHRWESTLCSIFQEFVACQDDKDPGVLILSPFAGAGGLMQEALQVR